VEGCIIRACSCLKVVVVQSEAESRNFGEVSRVLHLAVKWVKSSHAHCPLILQVTPLEGDFFKHLLVLSQPMPLHKAGERIYQQHHTPQKENGNTWGSKSTLCCRIEKVCSLTHLAVLYLKCTALHTIDLVIPGIPPTYATTAWWWAPPMTCHTFFLIAPTIIDHPLLPPHIQELGPRYRDTRWATLSPSCSPTSHPISAGTKMVSNVKRKGCTQVSTLPAHPPNSATTMSPRSVSASQDCEHCENGLDTPPNAMSTHHLSVNGQQTWTRMQTDVKNHENHLDCQIDQIASQDNPCECEQPTPPRTLPLPLSLSRDVGVHKTLKQGKHTTRITGLSHCWQPPQTWNTPGGIAKMHIQYMFWAEHQCVQLAPTSRTQHWHVQPNTSVLSQTLACTVQTVDGEDLVGTWWHRHHRGPKCSWGGQAISSNITSLS